MTDLLRGGDSIHNIQLHLIDRKVSNLQACTLNMHIYTRGVSNKRNSEINFFNIVHGSKVHEFAHIIQYFYLLRRL